jgi:hypothetical protein
LVEESDAANPAFESLANSMFACNSSSTSVLFLLQSSSLAIGRSSFLVSFFFFFFFFFFNLVEESDTKNPFGSFANSMLLATAAAQVCCFCYKVQV